MPAPTAGLSAFAVFAAAVVPAFCQEPSKPAAPAPEQALETVDKRDPGRKPKVAVFWAEGFPTVDAPAIPKGTLDRALKPFAHDFLSSSNDVKDKLKNLDYDV